MERTKLLTFAVIGLLLLNLLTISFLVLKSNPLLRPDQPFKQPGGEGPARLIIDRLHFDEQQQQQYLEMARQHHDQTERLNVKFVQLFQDYYSLLTAAKLDSAKANLLSRQIADIQRQIARLNFTHFQAIKSLCRPNQQVYFTQLVGDLARLFGRQQQPPRHDHDGPPGEHPDGPPENFPPHP